MDWGFYGNPFDHKPLLPNEVGSALFVGRSQEIEKLQRKIKNSDSIISIEGRNGVGKTSLANISTYRLFEDYLRAADDRKLFIPCRRTFQINKESSPEDFKFSVLIEIAQTLIETRNKIRGMGLSMPDSEQINNWLNSPTEKGWQLGFLDWLSIGKGGGSSNLGFEISGFIKHIEQWLQDIFPDSSCGGVVCIIDNIELLETSKTARTTIENLRDSLFTTPGIKWILCGANGIINSIVSSPRLEGYLQSPLSIGKILDISPTEVFKSRINHFLSRNRSGKYYMPLTEASFCRLYTILNYNLRSSLHHSQNFCNDIFENGTMPQNDEEKDAFFDSWLASHSQKVLDDIKRIIKPKSLDVFRKITSSPFDGVFSPSDYESLGFNKPETLRPYVKDLEEHGLLISHWDEEDTRRKSIQVTPKGWLVDYAQILD